VLVLRTDRNLPARPYAEPAHAAGGGRRVPNGCWARDPQVISAIPDLWGLASTT
jgi:hypothetical protein